MDRLVEKLRPAVFDAAGLHEHQVHLGEGFIGVPAYDGVVRRGAC